MKKIDLLGLRFGRLVVEAEAPKRGVNLAWLCKCDCGQKTIAMGLNLRRNRTKSCGCYRKDWPSENLRKPNRRTPEHLAWTSMKTRCTNPKSKSYSNYGGRGIRVCKEWEESFDAFFRDMGRRPTAAHSIDRVNVEGHYEPSNCRWATKIEQMRNKRNTLKITFLDVEMSAIEFSKIAGISVGRVYSRKSERLLQGTILCGEDLL